MWTTLALCLAVQAAPAQNAALALDNDRFTYGYFGAVRKDDGFLPGDIAYLAFDVRNMTFDANGRAVFSVAMEVLDGAGQVRCRQVPNTQQAHNPLGGNTLHSVAQVAVPPDSKPGEYTIRLTVQDLTNKASAKLEHKARILPADFGLVNVHTCADREGRVPAAPLGTIGEPLYLNFSIVGFQRDPATKQPNVEVSLRLLDDKGQPTTARARTGKADKDIPPELKVLPLQFGVTLNRLGRFTAELTATDKLTGKSARVSFPIKVTTLD
jgi:hypothetical protein